MHLSEMKRHLGKISKRARSIMKGEKTGRDARQVKLFAVVNGKVLIDLGDNISATYTRIYYLLNGLRSFGDLELDSIGFSPVPGKDMASIFYNNLTKSLVALRTAFRLARDRPVVYFAYPNSLTTVQNRILFKLCKLLKLKTVMDVQDTIEQADAVGNGKAVFSKEVERECLRDTSLILALNEPMWNHIKNRYGIGNKKVAFIPNAYEEEFCKIYPEGYSSVEGRFNICYIGGLTKNRGIDILIEACERLHKKYPYIRLHLYGPYGIDMPQGMKRTIEEREFITRKEIPRREIPSALQDVDLFVMPYNPEESYMNFSSPTKFFEYIGTGRPILCTRCESLLDVGEDSGVIYIQYSAQDIESKVELLVKNPRMREEISMKLMKLRPEHTWIERARTVHDAMRSL